MKVTKEYFTYFLVFCLLFALTGSSTAAENNIPNVPKSKILNTIKDVRKMISKNENINKNFAGMLLEDGVLKIGMVESDKVNKELFKETIKDEFKFDFWKAKHSYNDLLKGFDKINKNKENLRENGVPIVRFGISEKKTA